MDEESRSGDEVAFRTILERPGRCAYVRRSFNLVTGDITLERAFLDEIPSAERWVPTNPMMVPAKGTFLEAYLTMRQMRQAEQLAGNPNLFAQPHTVTMSNIVDGSTVCELARLEKAGVPLDQAIAQSHSVQYANRAITATGGRIASICVGPDSITLSVNAAWRSVGMTRDEIKAKYGLDPTDTVRMGFDIILAVEPDPAAARTTTPPAP